MQNYSPCAHLWECSQSGDRKIRFFLHNNRSQFPEEKIAFVFCPPDWLHFHDVQGVYLVQQNYTPRRAGSHRAVIADMVISCFLHFYFIPFLSYSPVPSLQTSSSSCSLFPFFPLLLPSFIYSFLLILPPSSSIFLSLLPLHLFFHQNVFFPMVKRLSFVIQYQMSQTTTLLQ